jgi:hypothetical protein
VLVEVQRGSRVLVEVERGSRMLLEVERGSRILVEVQRGSRVAPRNICHVAALKLYHTVFYVTLVFRLYSVSIIVQCFKTA